MPCLVAFSTLSPRRLLSDNLLVSLQGWWLLITKGMLPAASQDGSPLMEEATSPPNPATVPSMRQDNHMPLNQRMSTLGSLKD